jgi:hypothetical protein
MKAIIKIIIILLGTVSCQIPINKEQGKIKTFDLKEQPKISEVKLSELGFEDIEYIPLETNEKSSLGRFSLRGIADRFIVGNGFYIVKQFNTIIKFREDGSFANKIGTEGRGPSEFQVAHDMDTDKEGNRLLLVDGAQKKFNVYSEDGDFLRSFKIPFYVYAAVQFRLLEDKLLCYINNAQADIENSFVVIDTMGKIIKNFPNKYPFIPIKRGGVGVGKENLFYQFNNQLFKKEVYSDTVYVFDDMFFKPHLVIDVGDRLLTPEARAEFDLFYLSENYISPIHLFEFGDYIYYEYTYKIVPKTNNIKYGFIGSRTNDFQAFINAEQGLMNDLDGGPNILPETIKDENTVISWIDALTLKTYVASEGFRNSKPKYPEKKRKLEKLAESLKETDNPVLMVVTIKNR